MDSVVHGCADGSEVNRGRGPEVALYAEGTEPLCTQQLPKNIMHGAQRTNLERLFGVSREDDNSGNVGEYGAQITQERAEERYQLTAGHGKCARHGAAVFATIDVT